METLTIRIEIQKKSQEELDSVEKMLVEKAKEATFTSYAPYSQFSVGAALLLEDGTVIPGCNQENCVYPCGICAERSAIFAAGASLPDVKPIAICIAARDTSGSFTARPIVPCGQCRQVMSETEDRYHSPIRVILYGTDGTYMIGSAKDLLPVSFDSSYM